MAVDEGRHPLKPYWRHHRLHLDPFLATWHGDADTIVRFLDGTLVEWATRTPAAAARLGRVLDLEAEGTKVVVQLYPLTEEQALSLHDGGMVDVARVLRPTALAVVRELCVEQGSSGARELPGHAQLDFHTSAPEALCDLLISSLAPTWGPLLTVARRPLRGGRYIVVHPPGVDQILRF